MKANIKYKSVLADFKNIEERNYAFNNLDPQSQRLEIAWDALQLVLSGTIEGAIGDYWSSDLRKVVRRCETSKELQNALISKLPNCEVCARGGIMLSTIRLGNEIEPDQDHISAGTDRIVKGFSFEDMSLMEQAYEGWNHTYRDESPYPSRTTEQLANILCNVLVNGNFDINDTTNYLSI